MWLLAPLALSAKGGAASQGRKGQAVWLISTRLRLLAAWPFTSRFPLGCAGLALPFPSARRSSLSLLHLEFIVSHVGNDLRPVFTRVAITTHTLYFSAVLCMMRGTHPISHPTSVTVVGDVSCKNSRREVSAESKVPLPLPNSLFIYF